MTRSPNAWTQGERPETSERTFVGDRCLQVAMQEKEGESATGGNCAGILFDVSLNLSERKRGSSSVAEPRKFRLNSLALAAALAISLQ